MMQAMSDNDRNKLEFEHVIQTGRDKIYEFEIKGSEILKNIERKTDDTLKRIERKAEERGDKALNFVKWFVLLAFATAISLAASNRLSIESLDKTFMTKESARKVYDMQQYRFEKMIRNDSVPFDKTNYEWLIESLFDEKSRSNRNR
jgi:hypothetical protein